MLKKKCFLFLLLLGIVFQTQNVGAVRIKDVVSLRGMRDNQLIGFSIVIGLNGSGDTAESLLSKKPLKNALERMGISVNMSDIKGRSVAAVMVTSNLPPYAKQGQKLDVTVSSIGDAISLRGGILVLAPLRSTNRKVYAIAQGPVTGIPLGVESPQGLQVTGAQAYNFDPKRNIVPTVGRVISGATVEREIKLDLNSRSRIFLNLKEPDFTTAFRLAKVINQKLGDGSAKASDAGTVEVSVPYSYLGQTVELIAKIEAMEVEPDAVAKVVLDERTGTVVMGTNIRIQPIAISHGTLNILIGDNTGIIPPTPTQNAGNEVITIDDVTNSEQNNVFLFKGGVDLKEVVDGLNKIGVSNSDLLDILKTIKSAGALKADLIIK